jgi:hypothetical protein
MLDNPFFVNLCNSTLAAEPKMLTRYKFGSGQKQQLPHLSYYPTRYLEELREI